MLDFNLQLPKTGTQRQNAIKQIATLFGSLISSETSLVEDQTPEQTVHAFMKKQLRAPEYPMFLAVIFDDGEIPEEFAEYNIVTLQTVLDDATSGRMLELNDLFALETDESMIKLARAIGIKNQMSGVTFRMDILKRIYENLQTFERLYPTTEALSEFFGVRYAFDRQAESIRWQQLATRLDASRIIAENRSFYSKLSNVFGRWYNEAVQYFATSILEVESSTRPHMLSSRVAQMGPQNILRKLFDLGLLSSEKFEEFIKFENIEFDAVLKAIVQGWLDAFDGKEQNIVSVDGMSNDARTIMEQFVSEYRCDDEEDDEDDYDEEEEDEEEEDDEEDEDEEDDDAPPVKKVARRKVPDEEEDEDDEEDDEEESGAATQKELLGLLNEDIDVNDHSLSYWLNAKTEDVRRALIDSGTVPAHTVKSMRHYQLLEVMAEEADLCMDEVFSYSDIASVAYKNWMENWRSRFETSGYKLKVLSTVVRELVSGMELADYTTEEMENQIETYIECIESVSGLYKFADKFIAAVDKYKMQSGFNIDPVSNAPYPAPASEQHRKLMADAVAAKVVDPYRARNMSESELRAAMAEAEALKEETPVAKVTNENFREVIPTLSRQSLIAELAARGYSDNSLRKLGAPRLAEMFLNAMERLVNK